MSVTSGFFNSLNHDRLYNAEQMSSIFDGIINDGVYESIGDAFQVTPNSNVSNSVIVGSGRAWFDHTWTLNDAPFALDMGAPNLVLTRIDAVVIDVDRSDSVRKNSIIAVQGTPASDAQPPTMINTDRHTQYPVAYITRPPGDGGIIQTSQITYNVGKLVCPLVTGPLEVINSDNFFTQMNEDFDAFTDGLDEEFTIWFDGIKDLINDLNIGNINLVNSVDDVTIEWLTDSKKIQVKDRGITRNKLSFDLQTIIGVLDPSSWEYQDYYDYINSLTDASLEQTFTTQYLTSTVVSSWTATQISNLYDILKSDTSKDTLWNGVNWTEFSLPDFRNLTEKFGSSKYSSMIGKKVHLQMGSYGAHDFILIGMNHDTLSAGGTAFMTFQSEDIVTRQTFAFSGVNSATPYNQTPLATFVEGLINSFDAEVQTLIKEVNKTARYTDPIMPSQPLGMITSFNTRVWIATYNEIGLTVDKDYQDSIYDYWTNAHGSIGSSRPKNFNGSPSDWVVRNGLSDLGFNGTKYRGLTSDGDYRVDGHNVYYDFSEDARVSSNVLGNNAGIVPCFCI